MTPPSLFPRALVLPCFMLLLWTSATPALAVSETVRVPLNRMISAMRDELAAPKPKARDNPDKAGDAARQALLTLIQIKTGPSEEITEDDLQKVVTTFRSGAVGDTAELVKAALIADRESEAFARKHDNLLRRTREAAVSAKTAADLDTLDNDLLAAIHNLRKDDLTDREREPFDTLSGAHSFVRHWQEYLVAKNAGNSRDAEHALAAIAYEEGSVITIIPRSQLLQLIEDQHERPVPPVSLIMSIRSLEEIRDVLLQLQKQSRKAPAFIDFERIEAALSDIDKNYRQYLAGVPISLYIRSDGYATRSSEVGGKLAELHAMLLKKVLPRYIDAPAGMEARDDESVVAYLDRVTELAQARENQALAYRARETRNLLNRDQTLQIQDAVGLKTNASARNQEEAGQYSLAVASYLDCLASGSDLVPANTVGARLNALREAVPDDYQKGLEMHLKRPGSLAIQSDSDLGSAYSILIPAPKAGDAKEPVAPGH